VNNAVQQRKDGIKMKCR